MSETAPVGVRLSRCRCADCLAAYRAAQEGTVSQPAGQNPSHQPERCTDTRCGCKHPLLRDLPPPRPTRTRRAANLQRILDEEQPWRRD